MLSNVINIRCKVEKLVALIKLRTLDIIQKTLSLRFETIKLHFGLFIVSNMTSTIIPGGSETQPPHELLVLRGQAGGRCPQL